MQAGSGSEARREAREILETYFSESGFYTATMTPRGRLVAEVFDCRGEEFVSDYLEASGHLDPGVAVRLHDTCGALYGGQLSVEDAYDGWDEWEGVLRGFAEGYGLGSLCTLMALADPLTPEERISSDRALHLTGVVLVDGSPRSVQWGTIQAWWVPPCPRRCR
jgi:hypothetical protein